MRRENSFAAIILAAGSPRKGERPVQLRSYLGLPLVERMARMALAAGAAEVVVVAGELADEIRSRLGRLPVSVIENRAFSEGLASSIRTGVSALKSDPGAALLCLCDRPRITSQHMRSLVDQVLRDPGSGIAASAYDGVLGVPAAFHRSQFSSLLELAGPVGARQLIRAAGANPAIVEFAAANEAMPQETRSRNPRTCLRASDPPQRIFRFQAARAPPSQSIPFAAV